MFAQLSEIVGGRGVENFVFLHACGRLLVRIIPTLSISDHFFRVFCSYCLQYQIHPKTSKHFVYSKLEAFA